MRLPSSLLALVAIIAPFALAAPSARSGKIVHTPHGVRPASNVHAVPPGGSIHHVGNEIHVLDHSGKLVHSTKNDKTKVRPHSRRSEVGSSVERSSANADFALDSNTISKREATGWVAYAGWYNPDSSSPVNYFPTTWRVPSNPGTDHGQVVFLFNSIEPASENAILQPVVQYGPSAAGGGSYWSVASWYVSGSSSYYSTLITVQPGDLLIGVMNLINDNGDGTYNYLSQFTNIQGSALQLNNSPELMWCTETLEAYGVTERSDYPPGGTIFSQINVGTTSGTPDISWTTQSDVPDTLVCTVNTDGASDAVITIAY